ncbi:MAG: hypothetical protein DLM68_19640 [Hyphomicrobiales bacterium]|nr:MAG: hypothetical protein DLM68_19640 [Hyphomicrobiales bacterium]
MVKVAFLYASPHTRPIPHDDRKRVEQRHTDRAILTHAAKDGEDKGIALEGAVMELKCIPPRVFSRVIHGHAEMSAGAVRFDLDDLTDRPRKCCYVILVSEMI